MATEEAPTHSHTMVGGDGPNSYAQNSTYQKALLEAVKVKINEVISTSLDLKDPNFDLSSNTFKIADFGCSTGSNTLTAMQNVVEAVKLKYHKETHQDPKNIEFHVFFNDLVNNDFNTLFRSLPATRHYFAAGVPGSFFGRVFPSNSLHLGHCSHTLQWLSQVPKEIMDPCSPAWNNGSIHCTGFVKEVTDAYLEQFKRDMGMFFSARAHEIMSGGLMLLLGSCLPDGVLMSETMKGINLDCIGSCLNDMVQSGLVNKERVGSFNMPIYFAHLSELKQVIEENGCFSIEIIERVSHANEEFPLDAKILTRVTRAAFGGFIEDNFGKEVEDELMKRLEKKVEEGIPKFAKARQGMQFFIMLRRN